MIYTFSSPRVHQLSNFRISAVPPFPGLRRFPDGRDFKQWTGDDSKALMKVCVYLIGLSILIIPIKGFPCLNCWLCPVRDGPLHCGLHGRFLHRAS